MHSESGDNDGDDDERKFFGKFIQETWLSKRNKKVDEQVWQHQMNECCEVVEERYDHKAGSVVETRESLVVV